MKFLRASLFLAILLLFAATPFARLSAQEGGHADSHEGVAAANHDEAHEEDAHGADHHGEYSLWTDLPFWSLIAFIGFILAIKALGLWDVLLGSMSAREKAEIEAISLAESDLQSAQATLRESQGRMEAMDESIGELMEEAKRDATSTRESIIQQAEREADAAVSRARFEIERVKNQSLNELFDSLADKVTQVSEQRLREGLQPEDHHRLVNETLSQLVIH